MSTGAFRARVRWGSIGLASIAAGPAFMLNLALAAMLEQPDQAVPLGDPGEIVGGVLLFGAASALVGALIALPLATAGALILTRLGHYNVVARLPVFWALIGALACGMPMWIVGAGQSVLFLPLTLTGAMVASICRRRMEWISESRR